MKGFIGVLAAFSIVPAWAFEIPMQAKIAPVVQQKILMESFLKGDSLAVKIPALIYLKAKANLERANTLQTKEEKGEYVYNQLTQTASKSQKELKAFLDSEKVSYQSFYITNMIAVYDVSADLIVKIAAREDVEIILDNSKTSINLPGQSALLNAGLVFGESLEESEVGANIKAVKADQVWNDFKTQGEGIVIAGQDTGVDFAHSALVKSYRGNDNGNLSHDYNWHDSIHPGNQGDPSNVCGIATDAPCDDDEHGTHTLGTMVGKNDSKTVGVAPGSKWVACRNMDAGMGTPATYIECFEWFLAPYKKGQDPMVAGDPALAPDVINNSWGCPASEGCKGAEMVDALKAMEKAGIMVVVSAGNAGSKCSTIGDQPGTISDYMLSVGAYNHRDNKMAYFSSRGPSVLDGGIGPHVVAPGVSITSTVPGNTFNGAYWSGTSMAGPHVAGIVALMWSANPALKGNVVATRDLIKKTALKLETTETCGGIPGNVVPNNTSGYGMVDAYAAVKAAVEFKP